MKARAVIFDLDGVLIDSERANVESASRAFAETGRPLDPEEFRRVVGRHPLDYVPELARTRGLTPDGQSRLLERQYAAYEACSARLPPVEGAEFVIPRLARRGFRLAVATSSGRASARESLERIGLLGHFELLLTLEDVRERKPAPEIYRLALGRLELAPEQAVAVEDSPHGVRAARAAGLRCIGLRTPWVQDGDIAEADRVIDELAVLDRLLVLQ